MKKPFLKVVSFIAVTSLLINMHPLAVHASPSSILDQINQAEQEKKQAEEQKQQAEGAKNEKQNELNQLTFQQGTLKAQLNSFNVSSS